MPNMTTIRAQIKELDPKQAVWNIRKVDLEEILKNLREAQENTLENELTKDYKDFYKDFVMEEYKKEVKTYGRGSVRRGQNLLIYHKMIRNHGTILIAKDRSFILVFKNSERNLGS